MLLTKGVWTACVLWYAAIGDVVNEEIQVVLITDQVRALDSYSNHWLIHTLPRNGIPVIDPIVDNLLQGRPFGGSIQQKGHLIFGS